MRPPFEATATAKAKRGPSAKSGLQDDDPDRIVSVPPFRGHGNEKGNGKCNGQSNGHSNGHSNNCRTEVRRYI